MQAVYPALGTLGAGFLFDETSQGTVAPQTGKWTAALQRCALVEGKGDWGMSVRMRVLVMPALVLVISMVACGPSATQTPVATIQPPRTSTLSIVLPTPTSTPVLVPASPTAKPPTAPATPDLVISPSQFGQRVTLSVGQTIALLSPSSSSEWQISYSTTLFAMLTPPENIRTPGSQGWILRAIAPGESEIAVTMIAPPCVPPSPCPPNVARFVVPVSINP